MGTAPEGLWSVRLVALVAGFSLSMLLMEVMLEALFALERVPRTISLWNSTFAFFFCAALPAMLARWQRPQEKGLPKPAEDLERGKPTDEDRAGRHAVLLRTWAPYLCLSLMQFAAQTAANHSVHFVDFTVKVVFKASKLLPTMLVSTLMGNARSFTPVEYLAALLLCGGTAMFSHGGGKGHAGSDDSGAFATGVLLLVFAVLAEGVIPNAQQLLLKGGVDPNTLMIRTNIIGAVGGAVGLAVSGDVWQLAEFARGTPVVVPLLVGAGLMLSTSVMCYTRIIREVGSVFAVGASTLRKVVTVLLSFMLFPGKAFNAVRAVGLASVLAGVLLADFVARKPARAGREGERRPEFEPVGSSPPSVQVGRPAAALE